jgi:hypothetical protein
MSLPAIVLKYQQESAYSRLARLIRSLPGFANVFFNFTVRGRMMHERRRDFFSFHRLVRLFTMDMRCTRATGHEDQPRRTH